MTTDVCIPQEALCALLARCRALEEELRAYKGDVDMPAELDRLGLAGVYAPPHVLRLCATVAALSRVTPGGVASREAVARAMYGIEPGEAEYHAVRVQVTRVRVLLSLVGKTLQAHIGVGMRIVDIAAAAPLHPRAATFCRDCGGVCSPGTVRCWPCHLATVTHREPLACRECGGPCQRRGGRCRGCWHAERRALAKPARRCRDCGVVVTGKRSERCIPCAIRHRYPDTRRSLRRSVA